MFRQWLAAMVAVAISVAAFAGHCDEAEHWEHHLGAMTDGAGTNWSTPAAGHEEPCDHCGFCTGGVVMPESPSYLAPLAVERVGAQQRCLLFSFQHPPNYRPPRA